MNVRVYLNFDGRCDEALEYYRDKLDAEVLERMRFADCPDPLPDGFPTEKIMHCSFRIGETEVMASDMHSQGNPVFQGVTLALGVKNVAEAEQRFQALAEEGQVMQPLQQTFFSPAFGMVTDRFGVAWMVVTEP